VTSPPTDVRWKQRLASLEKALARLQEGAAIAAPTWNVLKDYLRAQGIEDVVGPRDAIRRSGSLGLLDDPELWFEMMQARNLSVHVYDDSQAAALFADIGQRYRVRLERFVAQMASRGGT